MEFPNVSPEISRISTLTGSENRPDSASMLRELGFSHEIDAEGRAETALSATRLLKFVWELI